MAKAKVKENSFFTGMESFEDTTATAPEAEAKTEVKAETKTEEQKEEKAPAPEKTVPLPQVKKKRERKTVRVPLLVTPSVASGMKIIAAREDRSVNDIVNELMKAYVEKNL